MVTCDSVSASHGDVTGCNAEAAYVLSRHMQLSTSNHSVDYVGLRIRLFACVLRLQASMQLKFVLATQLLAVYAPPPSLIPVTMVPKPA